MAWEHWNVYKKKEMLQYFSIKLITHFKNGFKVIAFIIYYDIILKMSLIRIMVYSQCR